MGRIRAGVTGSRNLIHRFGDNSRAEFCRNIGGLIGRVIVADDDFPGETLAAIGCEGILNPWQAVFEPALLVVSRDDHGQEHRRENRGIVGSDIALITILCFHRRITIFPASPDALFGINVSSWFWPLNVA